MPASSVNRSRQQVGGLPTIDKPSGSYGKKAVNKGKAQEQASRINTSIPRTALGSRNVRVVTQSEGKSLFSRIFSPFQSYSPTSAEIKKDLKAAKAEEQRKQRHSATGIMKEFRVGLKKSKSDILKGLADKKTNGQIIDFLKQDRGPFYQASDMAVAMVEHVSFRKLSAEEKERLPEASLKDLEQQSKQINDMSAAVAFGEFRPNTALFYTYKEGDKTYPDTIEECPGQDKEVKAWLRCGVELTCDLADAQHKILVEGQTLPPAKLDELKRRSDNFREGIVQPSTVQITEQAATSTQSGPAPDPNPTSIETEV